MEVLIPYEFPVLPNNPDIFSRIRNVKETCTFPGLPLKNHNYKLHENNRKIREKLLKIELT